MAGAESSSRADSTLLAQRQASRQRERAESWSSDFHWGPPLFPPWASHRSRRKARRVKKKKERKKKKRKKKRSMTSSSSSSEEKSSSDKEQELPPAGAAASSSSSQIGTAGAGKVASAQQAAGQSQKAFLSARLERARAVAQGRLAGTSDHSGEKQDVSSSDDLLSELSSPHEDHTLEEKEKKRRVHALSRAVSSTP